MVTRNRYDPHRKTYIVSSLLTAILLTESISNQHLLYCQCFCFMLSYCWSARALCTYLYLQRFMSSYCWNAYSSTTKVALASWRRCSYYQHYILYLQRCMSYCWCTYYYNTTEVARAMLEYVITISITYLYFKRFMSYFWCA
jgi:hypothetical protein